MTDTSTPADRIKTYLDGRPHVFDTISRYYPNWHGIGKRPAEVQLNESDLRAVLQQLADAHAALDQIEAKARAEEANGYALVYCALWDAHGILDNALNPISDEQAELDVANAVNYGPTDPAEQAAALADLEAEFLDDPGDGHDLA